MRLNVELSNTGPLGFYEKKATFVRWGTVGPDGVWYPPKGGPWTSDDEPEKGCTMMVTTDRALLGATTPKTSSLNTACALLHFADGKLVACWHGPAGTVCASPLPAWELADFANAGMKFSAPSSP